MADLMDHLFDSPAQFRILTALAPTDLFVYNRNHYGVHMIVVGWDSEFIRCSFIDLVCVHHSGEYIVGSELLFQEVIRFFVELFGVFITTVAIKIHRVHIENELIKERCIRSKTTPGGHSFLFHFGEDLHIRPVSGILEMYVVWYPLRVYIYIRIGIIFAFIVPLRGSDRGDPVLFHSDAAKIGFRHFFPFFSAQILI